MSSRQLTSTHAYTPIPLWRLSDLNSAVLSVSYDSLEPSANSGITIGTSNTVVCVVCSIHLCSYLSSLRCRSYVLPSAPPSAHHVLQVPCLWRFRHTDNLYCVVTLGGVSGDFRALSCRPHQLSQALPLTTSIGDLLLVTLLAPLASQQFLCSTLGMSGGLSLIDSAAPRLTCSHLSSVFFIASVLVTAAATMRRR